MPPDPSRRIRLDRLGSLAAGVTACLAALLSTGCGGGMDARVEAVVDDESVESPLTALLAIDDTAGAAAEAERQAQESIERCMALRGFVYVPETDFAPGPLGVGSEVEAEVESEPSLDHVEQHGYGLADALEVQVVGRVPEGPAAADPNENIRDALPESELAAYERALTGFAPSEIEWRETDGAPLDPLTGEVISRDAYLERSADGCTYQAYAGQDRQADRRAAELIMSAAYQDFQAGIRSDPRMVELIDGWAACMAGQGFAYHSPEEARLELRERGDELLHEVSSEHHDLGSDDAVRAIGELRIAEIRVAVADWECSDELFAEAPAIVREHEVEFIGNNEDLIVALLDERGA